MQRLSCHLVRPYGVASAYSGAQRAVASAYRARDVAALGGLFFGVRLGHVLTVHFYQSPGYAIRTAA